MTGSADTAGTNAVGAVFCYTVRANAISATFGYTVRTNTICTTFGYAVRANAICTTFSYAIRTNAISAVFGNAEALQSTLGATFGNTIDTNTISAIFSDYRSPGLLSGNLRQSERTGGQGGNDEAGENVLFHVRSPEEGASNWLRLSCYARSGTAKGTSRDSDHRRRRYLKKRFPISQIAITDDQATATPSTAQWANGTGICIKNQ
jgi:hypothetical protein